jgi:1,4-dihydroxy-2-naphthoate octaprenyltransferase
LTEKTLTPLQIWLLAIRPKTLPAATGPVIVGTAAAMSEGRFRPGPALAALAGALLLQIASNLANDVFDYKKGADTVGRLGPLRVTQSGLLTPGQVTSGLVLTLAMAALIGVYLILQGGWPILIVGVLAIISAVAYTGGPFPLGYHGLGDLFVFIFFGLAAVGGTYYVQAGRVSPLAWWSAVPVGLLVTAILVVNNLRDIESDRAVGKRTLAVRLGVRGARIEYLLLLALAYLAPLLIWVLNVGEPWVMLTWLSLFWARPQVEMVLGQKGRILNKALAGTARLELVYSLLFSLGLITDLAAW